MHAAAPSNTRTIRRRAENACEWGAPGCFSRARTAVAGARTDAGYLERLSAPGAHPPAGAWSGAQIGLGVEEVEVAVDLGLEPGDEAAAWGRNSARPVLWCVARGKRVRLCMTILPGRGVTPVTH